MSKCICQNGKFDEMKDKRRTKCKKKRRENEQKCESQTWPFEGYGLRPNFGLRMREFSFG